MRLESRNLQFIRDHLIFLLYTRNFNRHTARMQSGSLDLIPCLLGRFYKPLQDDERGSREGVRKVLRRFVSSNVSGEPNLEPDGTFASSVYGGSGGILAQLLDLKAWFEDQTIYHFNSCSVLMFYEKVTLLARGCSGAKVKLIEFAHVGEANCVIDHNFLDGLCSLIKFFSEMLTGPDECAIKICLQDSEEQELY